jgi:NTP pyrophosphatase (non-canonical NTP hydrolase)
MNQPFPEEVAELSAESGLSPAQVRECYNELPANEIIAEHAADVDSTFERARQSFVFGLALKRRTALQALRHALQKRDPLGRPPDGVSIYLMRSRALELLELLERLDAIDETAKKTDLDDLLAQDVSATTMVEKMATDLAYRMPNSGRPLSHIVLPRGGIENLLAMIQQQHGQGLTFADYAAKAISTAIYPGHAINAIAYLTLKLNGEAGEIAEKVGKAIRDANSVIDETRRLALLSELGDVIWYVNALASELDSSLSEIATKNLEKIASRRARNVVHGDGDDR